MDCAVEAWVCAAVWAVVACVVACVCAVDWAVVACVWAAVLLSLLLQDASRATAMMSIRTSAFFICFSPLSYVSCFIYDFIPVSVIDLTSCFSKMTNSMSTGRMAITDAARGALKTLSTQEGYRTFVVPDDVGGRYSVLTPVGLLPIVLAGFDVRAMLKGAADTAAALQSRSLDNPALQYAAMRNLLYTELGKKVEILVSYNPKFTYLGEWWKQLYGESEGKQGLGIFPASCVFTADLHSMGQYIQDGERMLQETFLAVKDSGVKLAVPSSAENADGLNYLTGMDYADIYACAKEGVKQAHIKGGVPCTEIEMAAKDERSLGALIYFFELACAVSGYMEGVNPFDQPGVEEYKKNMFALLKKA